MTSQAKRAFPQCNCSRFLMDTAATGTATVGQPLIFYFTPDGEYVEVDTVDILR